MVYISPQYVHCRAQRGRHICADPARYYRQDAQSGAQKRWLTKNTNIEKDQWQL